MADKLGVLSILAGLTQGVSEGIRQRKEFDLRERELSLKQELAQETGARELLKEQQRSEERAEDLALKEREVVAKEKAEGRREDFTTAKIKEIEAGTGKKKAETAKSSDKSEKDLMSQLEDNATKIKDLVKQRSFIGSAISFETDPEAIKEQQLNLSLIDEQITILRDSQDQIRSKLPEVKQTTIKTPTKPAGIQSDFRVKIDSAASQDDLRPIFEEAQGISDKNTQKAIFDQIKAKALQLGK